jgi:murein DD-endopeptidase MepM/ murein hydrolase activator NlpD
VRVVRWGPTWRLVVTILCIVGVLTPAAAGAAPDRNDLDRVNDRLDDARSQLRKVERRKAVEISDLERIDARSAELEAELADLGRKLGVAEGALAESQAQLQRTTQRLTAVEAKLADTRKRLEEGRDAFAARARSTYMYGGRAGWAHVITGMDSIEEFQRGLKYARTVLHNDQRQVERISALERIVQRTTVELGLLQDEHAAQRAVDAERRDAAAKIVAQREAVAAKVEAEADKRRLVIAQLEADEESYVALVDDLRTQSKQIEAELRRRAAAERARLAAQAAAEARRLAAAQRSRASAAAPSGGGSGSSSATPPTSTGALQWPASGPKTSDYGWRTHPIFGTRRFHAGIDIGAGYGAAIVAAASGVVVSAGAQGGYGNTVVIDHGGGLATLYAHQSSYAVSSGQRVDRGQVIGYVGSTGYSTGPHLHFETRVNGAPRDPMGYF